MYVPSEYPGMKMEYSSEAKFINDYLGPKFEKNNINTKIIAYDHNWDNLAYPSMVLQDAGKYVAGTAWHSYGGKHDAMTKIHDKYPDKGVWFTEASGGQWVPPFNDAFADQMMHIIRATRNYAKTVVWWNIALDQNNGPTVLKNSTCRGIVKIDTETKKITYNVDYYTMGHISKFVEPGAYRIDSTNMDNVLETTAFKNPDGSIVMIAQNRLPNDKVIEVKYGTSLFKYTLPGKAAVTFKWN
jgi:glucosylceramidase